MAYVKTRVDEINAFFLADVGAGRMMTPEAVEAVADGRIFIAEEARSLGLIDEVMTFEGAMEHLRAQFRTSGRVGRARVMMARRLAPRR